MQVSCWTEAALPLHQFIRTVIVEMILLRGSTSALLFIAFLCWGNEAHALDCGGRLSPIENAICSDKTLSDLHHSMRIAYRSAEECNLVRDDQERWIRRRDRTCGDWPNAACLAPMYRDRIDLLGNITASSFRCSPSIGEQFLILHGRWKVEALRSPTPDGLHAALSVPIGSVISYDYDGYSIQHGDRLPLPHERLGPLIIYDAHVPITRMRNLRKDMKAHGLLYEQIWIITLEMGEGAKPVIILQQDGTLLEWSEEIGTFSIWRPLDSGDYRVVRTEGPVN